MLKLCEEVGLGALSCSVTFPSISSLTILTRPSERVKAPVIYNPDDKDGSDGRVGLACHIILTCEVCIPYYIKVKWAPYQMMDCFCVLI